MWHRRRRKLCLSIENGQFFFFTKYTAKDDFSEPPRSADSTSGARGSVSVRFWGGRQLSPFGGGGGLATGLYRPPPPPPLPVESPPSPSCVTPVLPLTTSHTSPSPSPACRRCATNKSHTCVHHSSQSSSSDHTQTFNATLTLPRQLSTCRSRRSRLRPLQRPENPESTNHTDKCRMCTDGQRSCWTFLFARKGPPAFELVPLTSPLGTADVMSAFGAGGGVGVGLTGP